MKIAIHNNKRGYSKYWIEYCQAHSISYKIVSAYDNNIVEQVRDCDIFMWHHSHGSYKDQLFAKQLLFSLEQAGKIVFPNFNTGWHFDDKLGQKYLFEALDIKAAEAWAFFDKKSAYEWIVQASFPKVFKLRGGAGASNVRLVKSKSEAKKLVKKAFGRGFPAFSPLKYAWDEWKSYLRGKNRFYDVAKYLGLFLLPRKYNMHLQNKQKGYVYFQEFIPNDGFDTRVEIVGDKAIGLIRYTRENDFRASGSHNNKYDAELIPEGAIDFAFDVAEKLGIQAVALDLVQHKETKEFYLIETSYCYGVDDDEFDHGYWAKGAKLHKEEFNGIHWMIEHVIENYKKKEKSNKEAILLQHK